MIGIKFFYGTFFICEGYYCLGATEVRVFSFYIIKIWRPNHNRKIIQNSLLYSYIYVVQVWKVFQLLLNYWLQSFKRKIRLLAECSSSHEGSFSHAFVLRKTHFTDFIDIQGILTWPSYPLYLTSETLTGSKEGISLEECSRFQQILELCVVKSEYIYYVKNRGIFQSRKS